MQDIARKPSRCQDRRSQRIGADPDWLGAAVCQLLARLFGNTLFVFPLALILFLLVWQGVIWLGDYPRFILPSPSDVAIRGARGLADGTLWRHAQTTLFELFIGLAIGLLLAAALGYPLAKSQRLERVLAPYLVASQSVPVVAIAPLLVIWFGSGRLSKVLVCALMVFFPLLVNIMIGIRSVPDELRDLMRSLRAGRWQTFWMLEVPAALPVVFGGMRIAVTLAVVGAVVGEFVGADRGLGFLINQSRGLFDTPMVFVTIIALVCLAMSLYGVVMVLELRLSRWRS